MGILKNLLAHVKPLYLIERGGEEVNLIKVDINVRNNMTFQ